jgi:hypothetical protein
MACSVLRTLGNDKKGANMYIIKKTRLGVKHWRLQLQDQSGGVVFTAFYKDFTLADSLEHFKQTIKERFGN